MSETTETRFVWGSADGVVKLEQIGETVAGALHGTPITKWKITVGSVSQEWTSVGLGEPNLEVVKDLAHFLLKEEAFACIKYAGELFFTNALMGAEFTFEALEALLSPPNKEKHDE